jgi:GTP cyclohydrolase II
VTVGRDGTLVAVARETVATRHGPFVVHRFHNCTTGAPALAVACGDLAGEEPRASRVHSSCVTSEALGACDCDCAEQLDAALAHVAARGRGVLFYLTQEGRGAGFVAKALDRMLVQASGNRLTTFEAYARLGLPDDQRSYGEVAAMARLLGITAPLWLLSNNPEKVAALARAGARLDGTEPLRIATSAYSQHYLEAKSRAGHTVAATDDVDPATPPEAVRVIGPEPLVAAPRFVRLASYLLPVRRAAPVWFRLHAYLDARARRERVLLTHGAGGADVLVRLQRDALLDRLPLAAPRHRHAWDDAVARIVAHGRGIVLFAGTDDDVADVAAPLAGAHLEGRRAIPLVLPGDEPGDATLVRGLAGG